MINEKSRISKISDILITLSKKVRIIVIAIIVYFTILIIYDLVVYNRSFKDIIITYLSVIVVGVLVWFGMRFVFWLQIKNKYCPEKILNIFVIVALSVFAISSILMGIQYFIDGFLVSAFIAPIALISLLKVQSLRI